MRAHPAMGAHTPPGRFRTEPLVLGGISLTRPRTRAEIGPVTGAIALPIGARTDWSQWLRGPEDQPRWARPALLATATLAGVLYVWGIGAQTPHLYYAAVARSMSMSWHNFFFAAFDPAATISIDKLPGAIWLQALSTRIFGPHLWAYLLPQVIEGVLTVLVLHRAVRRLSGPGAALVAAAVAAVTPATVTLNRGNIPSRARTRWLAWSSPARSGWS
ncbi:hypothetical protein GL305_01215 [Nocardia seriolae]|nr:hypothetical protein [Nocardia seriolae]MTJ75823.1 hypothetical protein [Nocardia seriolae]MTJ84683.1 hypothetical protein [Nocardia seriolae]MTK28671.1 hypothetical protein [Nocardia seriolae]MTK38411.1 hypothetical protein [Nocardia seriolae]